MSGWEDSLESREPSPEDVASQREEREHGAAAAIAEAFGEEEKRLLGGVLRQLMKTDGARYIVFREFLLRAGTLSVLRGGEVAGKPYRGFYTELAERWNCSSNTVKNWLNEALEFILEHGRQAARR